jgi:hypothetical protein
VTTRRSSDTFHSKTGYDDGGSVKFVKDYLFVLVSRSLGVKRTLALRRRRGEKKDFSVLACRNCVSCKRKALLSTAKNGSQSKSQIKITKSTQHY